MKSSFNRFISTLDVAEGKKMSESEDRLIEISISALLQMQKQKKNGEKQNRMEYSKVVGQYKINCRRDNFNDNQCKVIRDNNIEIHTYKKLGNIHFKIS